MECFTCNSVWHRKCADSLPNKGPTLQYWQCDICVEEEIAEYGTSRDQLRPQQPALTIDAETATEKAIQPTDESDESQDEESDLEIEDSETDEEWKDTTHSKPAATPATKIGGRRRRKRKKQKTINLDGSSDDDEDEQIVSTSNTNTNNNDNDNAKSDTATINITSLPTEAKLTKQQQRGHPPPLLQQTEQGTQKPKDNNNTIDMSAATLDV